MAKAHVWSVVVAGGSGRRFGRMKQFSLLGGRPVLDWAVQACRRCSDGVVLVVPADDGDDVPDADTHGADTHGADTHGADTHGADTIVTGGPTRADSVRRGLAAVPDDADVIVVHDAARPLASPALFSAVIGAVTDGSADGAVPGLTPSDTIKVVDDAGLVTGTLHRHTLSAVQTPQAFRAAILRRAHEQGSPGATDDAVLVEALGGRVRVVPGEPDNLKITTPEDLRTAEHLLAGTRDGS